MSNRLTPEQELVTCEVCEIFEYIRLTSDTHSGRLVRLIPDNGDDPERIAIKILFNHRLPKDSREARLEWLDIVEGTSDLWRSISPPKRELIRAFLNSVNLEAVKRARPSSTFNFSSASIGNLFLTGYGLAK